jgi:hypothetical protein
LVGFLVAGTTRLFVHLASSEELAHAVRVSVLDAVTLSKELLGLREMVAISPRFMAS